MSTYNLEIYACKVVLLGESAVGKTSLATRFVNNQFSEFEESTIGAAFLSKALTINNKTIKFEIWDTAGQERYQSLAPMYYRGAKVGIIVFDLTNRSTFDKAKRWVEELRQSGPENILLLLIGNKLDLENRRQLTYDECNNYAIESDLIYIETSAKKDTNVEKIFEEIGQNVELEPLVLGNNIFYVDQKNNKKSCCKQ